MKRNTFIKASLTILAGLFSSPKGFGAISLTKSGFKDYSELWKLSAVEIASLIKAKDISVKEVIQAHIKRIQEVNPTVNAISSVLEEGALKLALEKDKQLQGTFQVPQLFGVPFSIKDNIDLKGSATTEGITAFKNNIAKVDAPQVELFKNAGAIPLARTNMPDFALRYHTESQLLGTSLNPWNHELTCGGSSGGDAVAVATGMVPIGLGNDYGGSLRYPAQCNGVCAIRPTRGRVPYFSASIPYNNVPHSVKMFAVQGPIARTIEDLELALGIMSNPDYRDPHFIPIKQSSHLKQQYKIALITNPGNFGVDTAIENTVIKAGQILESNGCIVEEIDSSSLRESMELWAQIVTTDIRNVFLDVLNSNASTNAMQFVDAFLNLYPSLTIRQYVNALSRVNGVAASWNAAFQNFDAVVGPISSRQPFKIGFDIKGQDEAKRLLESQSLSVTANLLGLPSVATPVEISNNLPQSVQIICSSFNEDRCFDLAKIIEWNAGRLTPITPKF
jgi:amidase